MIAIFMINKPLDVFINTSFKLWYAFNFFSRSSSYQCFHKAVFLLFWVCSACRKSSCFFCSTLLFTAAWVKAVSACMRSLLVAFITGLNVSKMRESLVRDDGWIETHSPLLSLLIDIRNLILAIIDIRSVIGLREDASTLRLLVIPYCLLTCLFSCGVKSVLLHHSLKLLNYTPFKVLSSRAVCNFN